MLCTCFGWFHIACAQQVVARFNDPASSVAVFLLSMRAGGVGLNLQVHITDSFPRRQLECMYMRMQLMPELMRRSSVCLQAADTVIMFDTDWNPQARHMLCAFHVAPMLPHELLMSHHFHNIAPHS